MGNKEERKGLKGGEGERQEGEKKEIGQLLA